MFESARPVPFDDQLRWRVVQVPSGGTMRGWVCGPLVGVWTHWGRHTKPCRHAITTGALPCQHGPKCRPRYIAYLPLIESKSRAQVVVILARTPALRWQGITLPTPVSISRPLAGNHPAYVLHTLADDEMPAAATRQILDRGPQDIRRYLLHLWQDRVLCDHYGVQMFESTSTADPPAMAE